MKPTLKIIRDSELLIDAVIENGSTFAAECSLLKWSPENRKWLFENYKEGVDCGLCCWFDHCGPCPLRACGTREDFKRARYAKDFETFNEAAEAFYSWMKGKLKNETNAENN